MRHIRKCSECGSYTMKEQCCGKQTIYPFSPKFSPEDPYAKYRRQYKSQQN